MGKKNFFYKGHEPTSGLAKKLWDWFNREMIDDVHKEFYLCINHPGFWQRSQGTPDYCITYCGCDYVCNANEVNMIVSTKTKKDYKKQFRDNTTGVYYL